MHNAHGLTAGRLRIAGVLMVGLGTLIPGACSAQRTKPPVDTGNNGGPTKIAPMPLPVPPPPPPHGPINTGNNGGPARKIPQRAIVIHVTLDGKDVIAARVRVSQMNSKLVGKRIVTRADGTAKLRLRPGQYQVKATRKTMSATQPFTVESGVEPVVVEVDLSKK